MVVISENVTIEKPIIQERSARVGGEMKRRRVQLSYKGRVEASKAMFGDAIMK